MRGKLLIDIVGVLIELSVLFSISVIPVEAEVEKASLVIDKVWELRFSIPGSIVDVYGVASDRENYYVLLVADGMCIAL